MHVLLSGVISSNPGPPKPVEVDVLNCGLRKKDIRQNQPRMMCNSCNLYFHLACFGHGFEIARQCRRCFVNSTGEEVHNSNDKYCPSKLYKMVNLRGFKIVHQNIQSLGHSIGNRQ